MKKISYMMMIIIPIIFSASVTNATGTTQWRSYSDIAINKEWTITFNQAIAANSISDNVYLVDSNNKKIAITVSVSSNVLNVKPKEDLNYSTSYKLVVTNQLQSTKGKAMNQEIVIPFTTIDKTTDTKAATTARNLKTLINRRPIVYL